MQNLTHALRNLRLRQPTRANVALMQVLIPFAKQTLALYDAPINVQILPTRVAFQSCALGG